MKNRIISKFAILICLFASLSVSCKTTEKLQPSLKDTLKNKFLIGVAINIDQALCVRKKGNRHIDTI